MLKSFKFPLLFLCLGSCLSCSPESSQESKKNSMELSLFFNSILIPSEAGHTNPDWKYITNNLNSINWITEGIAEAPVFYQKQGNSFYKQGSVVFNVNGMPTHEILGKTAELGQWSVKLFGARPFINEISINMLNNTQELNLDIVSILKNNKYSVATYKCSRESEPASSGNVVYTIETQGFKPAWLKDEWSCGSAGCASYITLYYSKEAAEKTECYGT